MKKLDADLKTASLYLRKGRDKDRPSRRGSIGGGGVGISSDLGIKILLRRKDPQKARKNQNFNMVRLQSRKVAVAREHAKARREEAGEAP